VKSSNVDVSIELARVGLIDGLRETMAKGIFSSLQPQNLRLRRAIRNLDVVAKHPLFPVLFDPQTAGGLLASLPQSRAEACIGALKATGYAYSAIIGKVRERSPALEPITIQLDDCEVPAHSSQLAVQGAPNKPEVPRDAHESVL